MTDEPALPDFDPRDIVELDVRDELRAGREPLNRIILAIQSLPPHGILHVRTTFRPRPLLDLLAHQGFRHHTESYAADDWSNWFWKGEPEKRDARSEERDAGSETRDARPDGASLPIVADITDLRPFPPPQPLTWILERVEIDAGPFDVLLPFFPAPLEPLLAPLGRRVVMIAEGGDGVHVRIEAAPRP